MDIVESQGSVYAGRGSVVTTAPSEVGGSG